MLRFLFVALAVGIAPTAALAQSASPTPAPAASVTGSSIAPALGVNDPCTSISAIVTRPTVTNSVCTVRPNHVLLETGYQNTSADGGGNSVTGPQAYLRIGTSVPALEIDVSAPSFASVSGPAGHATGTTDMGAGLKYVIGYGPRWSYGALVGFTLPTGSQGFTAGHSDETYAFNVGYAINSVFSLAATASQQSVTNGAQRYASFVPSLMLSAALPASTSVFGEVATWTDATGPLTPVRTQYLLGASHVLDARLQIDLETAISPTTSTGKYHYIGGGLSYYL